MNDLELKQLWQQQVMQTPPMPAGNLVDLMKRRMRRFDRAILWRDAREIGACVLVIIWMGTVFSAQASWLSRVGKLAVILSCVFIVARILWTRHSQRPSSRPMSVRESLLGELDKVKRQIHLLQTVLWWYILPLFLGVTLDILGGPGGWIGKTITLLFLLGAGWFVRWLNRYAVAKVLRPMQNELEQTLNSTPEFSEPINIETPKE